MPDFSDGYFEELKKKIRFITEDHHKLSPSKEESPKTEPAKEAPHMKAMGTGPNLFVEVEAPSGQQKNAIIFSLKNQVTGLVRALRVFQVCNCVSTKFISRMYLYLKEFNINVRHIESRKSRRKTSQYEIYVDIDCEDKEKMNILLHHLRYWI